MLLMRSLLYVAVSDFFSIFPLYSRHFPVFFTQAAARPQNIGRHKNGRILPFGEKVMENEKYLQKIRQKSGETPSNRKNHHYLLDITFKRPQAHTI